MMRQSRAAFEGSLLDRGLPIEFSGRPLYKWTSVQLHQLARLFQPFATFRSGHTKLDLCEQLISAKPNALSAAERRAASAISYGEDSKWAKSLLVDRPLILPSSSSYVRIAQQNTAKERLSTPELFPQRKTCEICSCDEPVSTFLECPDDSDCTHDTTTVCAPCVASYIGHQVSSSALDEIKCPEPGCDAVLSYKQMKKHALPELFERYDEYVFRRTLEQNPDFFRCAKDKCCGGGIADEAYTTFITCSECETKTCITCDTVWHAAISHHQNLANLKRELDDLGLTKKREEEEKTAQWMAKNTKLCPNKACGGSCRIQKDGGCDHMTCDKCKHEFCWLCFAAYKPIRAKGNHWHKPSCNHYRPHRRARPPPGGDVEQSRRPMADRIAVHRIRSSNHGRQGVVKRLRDVMARSQAVDASPGATGASRRSAHASNLQIHHNLLRRAVTPAIEPGTTTQTTTRTATPPLNPPGWRPATTSTSLLHSPLSAGIPVYLPTPRYDDPDDERRRVNAASKFPD